MDTYGELKYSSTHCLPHHWMDVSGQLHSPVALSPGKDNLYSLDRKLGGPRSGRGGEEKNRQPLPSIEACSSNQQPRPVPNEHSWFLLKNKF